LLKILIDIYNLIYLNITSEEEFTMTTTYSLFVKRFILKFIQDGSKDLEVRICSNRFEKIQVGDIIIFNDICHRKVKAVRKYPNFEKMLDAEDHSRIYPEVSRRELMKGLRRIFGNQDKQNGVIVFELESV